jgi:hypothetical protein
MKLLLLIAARGGAGDELTTTLLAEAVRLGEHGATSVCAMRQIPNDPFGSAVPCMRPFDASIDARFDSIEAAGAAIDGLSERIASVAHLDLSGAFGGEDHVVIDCAPTPVRYQYLMRRKIHTSHDAYLDHYIENHAKFGLRTPGIEGYVQFHIDAASSRALATIADLGLWAADSVSELHVASVSTMLEGFASAPTLGDDAGADEETFVDRANSVMFTSDVLYRS